MTLTAILSKLPKLYPTSNSDINKESWYLVVAVIMTTLNQPKNLSQLYHQVIQTTSTLQTNEEEHTAFVLRMKEGLLKSSPIIGIPKVINALSTFHSILPDHIKGQLPKTTSRTIESWDDIINQQERGQALFQRIYDRHSQKLQSSLQASYPDLALVCDNTYASILSHSSIINSLDTSFILITALMIQQLPAQLKGHYYGSIHHGATQQQFISLQSIIEKLCNYYNAPFDPLPLK
ncbi:unnamed protein product [Cunninghamella echinulata]